eukprot:GEZU01014280.1.p1 GENE.GEZU01014280.1~~GEZU01014280.1.p1  ORF type:complete len:210 (+),score=16.47 GEZU01014280.1:200-829(+)
MRLFQKVFTISIRTQLWIRGTPIRTSLYTGALMCMVLCRLIHTASATVNEELLNENDKDDIHEMEPGTFSISNPTTFFSSRYQLWACFGLAYLAVGAILVLLCDKMVQKDTEEEEMAQASEEKAARFEGEREKHRVKHTLLYAAMTSEGDDAVSDADFDLNYDIDAILEGRSSKKVSKKRVPYNQYRYRCRCDEAEDVFNTPRCHYRCF